MRKRTVIGYAISALLLLYVMRLYQVEAAREHSQDGVLRVLVDTFPDIRYKKIDIWANGIGCQYSWRLKHCIGIELGRSAVKIEDISQRATNVFNNFCAIVEQRYEIESYAPKSRPRTREVYLDINHAYFTYFDCERTRKPIGEVLLHISKEPKLTGNQNKADLVARIGR